MCIFEPATTSELSCVRASPRIVFFLCCTSASQLCTKEYTPKYYHFDIYKYMYTSGRSTMHVMVQFCNRSCRCMSSLRGGWATHPEAASTGTPLCQDGQHSTCDISGPRRPPGTFDTPNRTVSSVPVGWWRSGAANWKTSVDIFSSDMKTRCLEPRDRC
jgi:hypothetical protein